MPVCLVFVIELQRKFGIGDQRLQGATRGRRAVVSRPSASAIHARTRSAGPFDQLIVAINIGLDRRPLQSEECQRLEPNPPARIAAGVVALNRTCR
jgi:hypothetical protein